MAKWNKLVRDKIPDLLTKEGKLFRTIELDDGQYMDVLTDKLVEEAMEVHSDWENSGVGKKKELYEELADVLEVVYAIVDKMKLSREELENIRQKKVEEKGAFNQKSFITEVI